MKRNQGILFIICVVVTGLIMWFLALALFAIPVAHGASEREAFMCSVGTGPCEPDTTTYDEPVATVTAPVGVTAQVKLRVETPSIDKASKEEISRLEEIIVQLKKILNVLVIRYAN